MTAADDITRLVRQKLQRFADCAEDSDGCDIGRDWFDALTTIGLLERTKRSPAEWMMTPAGHDLLATPPAHSPDAGVTDEMVELARAAYYDKAFIEDGVYTDPIAMRAALTAALSPQPKDAT